MGVVLRLLGPDDVAELRRIHATPEVARWWGAPDDDFLGPGEPGETRLTIEVDGAVAGLIQFWEETDARYRHASVDVFLDPALHGRGHGTAALHLVVARLHELGHHRITIDPAVANVAAIRAYEKAGFRAVGVMRAYERDVSGPGWHDGLLMEHVFLAASACASPQSREVG